MDTLSRRLRRYYVDDQDLLSLFWSASLPMNGHILRLDADAKLPPGARVLGVQHDWTHKAFGVLVEHESFPEVPDGGLIPAEPWGGLAFVYVRVDLDESVSQEAENAANYVLGKTVCIEYMQPDGARPAHFNSAPYLELLEQAKVLAAFVLFGKSPAADEPRSFGDPSRPLSADVPVTAGP